MAQNLSYDMTAVHEASLEILKEIDRICRKYKIRYCLDAGTLIGAVRHHGFIPWDDDADVAMVRSQYEAFKKVAKQELPPHMELLEPDSFRGGKAFYDFTPRIIYKNSSCHGNTPEMAFYEGKLNHIWVDLFTIDRLPEGKLGIWWTKLLQKAVYGLAMGHRYHLDYKKYTLAQKIMVGGLATLGKFIPLKLIFKVQDAISKKDRKSKGNLCYYSTYQPDFMYVTVERDWCYGVEDMEFEDTRLMVPKGWDPILREVYGDYMQLPPVEKRIPTHSTQEIRVWK